MIKRSEVPRGVLTRVVGFTGTRKGMSPEQKRGVTAVMLDIIDEQRMGRVDKVRAVHGDCVGADAHFDRICKALGIEVGVRPCTFRNLRVFCDSPQLAEPKHPMDRNRDIIADADILIATPISFTAVLRSGTWATIGFGNEKGIPVHIVFPNGMHELWCGLPNQRICTRKQPNGGRN